MQEGHNGGAEPGAGDETSPGGSWAPPPGTAPAPTGQPGYGQPGYGQPGSTPTTELGTWSMSAGGQGTWEPPPGGGHGGWGPPPAGGPGQPGGYGQPGGGGYGQAGGGYIGADYGQPGGPQQPRRGNRPLVYLLVAVLAAALGAGAVLALQARSQPSRSAEPGQIPSPGGQGNGNTSTSTINPQAVAAKVEPGVVNITSTLRYTGQVFEGTGMVLTSSGLVLTNNHVVNGSTGQTATLVSSGRKYTAEIVGTDAQDDVALLRLVGASGLQTVAVGDSGKVRLGTQVVALGNAGGAGGAPTVTSGSITALRRTITASDSGSGTSETLHNMLQTNAPIAEGDSGGPLSNAAGQVIAMDTAANTQNLGGAGTSQGFAIPINRALAIARQMAAGHGSSTIHLGQAPFMGVEVARISSAATSPQQQFRQLRQVARQFGAVNSTGTCLPNNSVNPLPRQAAPASSGTLIAGVLCGTPARAAGLTGGDVITGVDSHPITGPDSLTSSLARYRPGETISVTWTDLNGGQHTSSLTLTQGPVK